MASRLSILALLFAPLVLKPYHELARWWREQTRFKLVLVLEIVALMSVVFLVTHFELVFLILKYAIWMLGPLGYKLASESQDTFRRARMEQARSRTWTGCKVWMNVFFGCDPSRQLWTTFRGHRSVSDALRISPRLFRRRWISQTSSVSR